MNSAMDEPTCKFARLAPARGGQYLEQESAVCGLVKEEVETSRGVYLMCPEHDRGPNYSPPWSV